MKKLLLQHQKKLRDFKEVDFVDRQVFKKMETEHRIVGVVGSRGIGKTSYMLNYIDKNFGNSTQALYITADSIFLQDYLLVDLVEDFVNNYDGKLLCIDEIHRYPNWSQELKNIYDIYSHQLKIVFSGSSSIDLIKEKYDLSRRAVLRHLPGFSFREYLEIQTGKNLPIISLDEIVKNRVSTEISSIPKLLGHFKKYLKIGYYPLSLEIKNTQDYLEALMGVIDKTIYTDISSYYSLQTDTLLVLLKILIFIYSTKPSKINANRIASSLKKDYKSVVSYIEMLRDSGLLEFVMTDRYGHAQLRNAEKVFLNNHNLYYALEYKIGKSFDLGQLRELFVLNQLNNSGLKPFYSKDVDLSCEDYLFEIGGINKTIEQIKSLKNAYLVKDDVLYGGKYSIPLWMFGFLY